MGPCGAQFLPFSPPLFFFFSSLFFFFRFFFYIRRRFIGPEPTPAVHVHVFGLHHLWKRTLYRLEVYNFMGTIFQK